MNKPSFMSLQFSGELAMRRVFNAAPLSRRVLSAICFSALAVAPAAWAFNSGSTGADGALAPAVNIQVQLPPSGILNYTSINIPSGVTVTFKRNALNTPVVLLVSGNVTVTGVINVSGTDGANIGTTGDGNLADDGLPGLGGPGGFDGGRGGAMDSAQRAAVVDGGAGQGPGGGQGGRIPTGEPYYVPSVGVYCRDNRVNGYEVYGLGGGFSVPGPDAYFAIYKCQGQSPAAPAYGSARQQPLIGGSGGGGGRGQSDYAGSGGGGGGGAILIASSGSVTITGSIQADGGNSGRYQAYYGGGGSGGAIYVAASSITGTGQVYARGGCAQASYGGQQCDPSLGSGAPGRIRLAAESIAFSGTSSPLYAADVPTAIDLASTPTVRFTTVAGVVVPAQPTGLADITLPANLSNPVTVAFATTGIPLGSTVRLRVIPAQGLPIDASSTPVAGTLQNGTASASASLPQGPSRLEATASFTVNVTVGQSLSRFAGNEVVKSVELMAGLDGSSRAVLVTVHGTRHEVPVGLLRTAGIGG